MNIINLINQALNTTSKAPKYLTPLECGCMLEGLRPDNHNNPYCISLLEFDDENNMKVKLHNTKLCEFCTEDIKQNGQLEIMLYALYRYCIEHKYKYLQYKGKTDAATRDALKNMGYPYEFAPHSTTIISGRLNLKTGKAE